MWRTMPGGERETPWYACRVLARPGRGEGERWGERGWGGQQEVDAAAAAAAAEEVQASGDGGMLLVDLRRPALV